MKIIHLTDTHFARFGQEVYGRSPLLALEKAVKSINAEHRDAEMMIVTGDLAHSGDYEAYQGLFHVLSKLLIPYYLVMGNHDSRTGMKSVFKDLPVDKSGFIQYGIRAGERLFLLLDTVEAGTHAGFYCGKRFQWLQEQLASSGQDIYIFMHHAPFDTGIPSMDKIGLDKQQAERLGDLLVSCRRVKHIFFGHYHRPVSGQWRGIPFSALRSMNHQVRLDLRCESVIPGCFEEPQYCVVLLKGDRTIVHYHDYMHQSRRFEIGSPLTAHE